MAKSWNRCSTYLPVNLNEAAQAEIYDSVHDLISFLHLICLSIYFYYVTKWFINVIPINLHIAQSNGYIFILIHSYTHWALSPALLMTLRFWVLLLFCTFFFKCLYYIYLLGYNLSLVSFFFTAQNSVLNGKHQHYYEQPINHSKCLCFLHMW